VIWRYGQPDGQALAHAVKVSAHSSLNICFKRIYLALYERISCADKIFVPGARVTDIPIAWYLCKAGQADNQEVFIVSQPVEHGLG